MLLHFFQFMPKPFNEGFLPEQDGHKIHYVQYGNPQGIPVLSFHGGPGGCSRPKYAKLFNLKKYRFIQFDQRGCGLSEYENLIFANNTQALISDAARLLDFLKIRVPIIVHGCSWGSTMALLFAEAYPKLVQKIVVHSVFLARVQDSAWLMHDSERFYPDLWQEMRQQVHTRNILPAYEKLLFSENEADNLKALSYWGSYEYQLGELNPQFEKITEATPETLNSARIYLTFTKNHFFIADNQITDNIASIKNIPMLIAHNRMDFCCLVNQAWDLHMASPNSRLIINPGYGHSTPQLLQVVKKALKDFL